MDIIERWANNLYLKILLVLIKYVVLKKIYWSTWVDWFKKNQIYMIF